MIRGTLLWLTVPAENIVAGRKLKKIGVISQKSSENNIILSMQLVLTPS